MRIGASWESDHATAGATRWLETDMSVEDLIAILEDQIGERP